MAADPTKSSCLLHLPSNLMGLKGIMMNNLLPLPIQESLDLPLSS